MLNNTTQEKLKGMLVVTVNLICVCVYTYICIYTPYYYSQKNKYKIIFMTKAIQDKKEENAL